MTTPPAYCRFGRCYCSYSRRVADRPIERDVIKYCRRYCESPRGQEQVMAIVQEKGKWYARLGLEIKD